MALAQSGHPSVIHPLSNNHLTCVQELPSLLPHVGIIQLTDHLKGLNHFQMP